MLLSFCLLVPASASRAQDELVAVLEVTKAGVEVQTANTNRWVEVKTETLINVGDRIRTNGSGEGRITFFEDGTAIDLTPNSEVLVQDFKGTEDQYNLTLEVVSGIIQHQVTTLTDPGSSYEVITPGMSLAVRGTNFAVRVEDTGRSALLTSQGSVDASAEGKDAPVGTGFGVRAEAGSVLSDVVPATSFDELDSALDGCNGSVISPADVRLYVRVGPSRDLAQIGSIDPNAIDHFLGFTGENGWYRIPYKGGFGWIDSSTFKVSIAENCPTLRQYDTVPVEDASLYTALELSGDAIVLVTDSNFRQGPGLSYPVQGTLNVGEVISITGKDESGSWLQVHTQDGRFGWIFADLVRLYIDPNLIDVIVEPTSEATPESSN